MPATTDPVGHAGPVPAVTGHDYGSPLLGSTTDTKLVRRIRVQTLVTIAAELPNAIAVVLILLITTVGIPNPPMIEHRLWWINFVLLPVYVLGAFACGMGYGTATCLRRLRWAVAGRRPTPEEAREVLLVPGFLTRMQAWFWAVAAVLFTTLFGLQNSEYIAKVGLATGLSGIVACTASYLLVEFALRPIAAQALAVIEPEHRRSSGLRNRMIATWAVGTGVPVLGILLTGLFSYTGPPMTRSQLAVAVCGLAAIALITSGALVYFGSGAMLDPIRSVQRAMRRVSQGDQDVQVTVYDGTDLGELQAGFNSMVQGLAERERLHDLFGRHVGREVAARALASDVELGGSEQLVAVVFVDVIGSTSLAQQRSPSEVVAILNRFFEVVVDAVESHHGLVNKFEGDAVLAIFGAPIDLDDPAGSALGAARRLGAGLAEQVPEVAAGIGVAYGSVVAGNVGAIQRFEYTVIGDPVNQSARLAEVAKSEPGRPIASGAAVEHAAPGEAQCWTQVGSTVLRGRSEPTALYAPCQAPQVEPVELVRGLA